LFYTPALSFASHIKPAVAPFLPAASRTRSGTGPDNGGPAALLIPPHQAGLFAGRIQLSTG